MENVAAAIEARQAQAAASGKPTRCPVCERKGLPILPVRYAVCKRLRSNVDIPELPAGRVSDFTDITLDKALENGAEVAKQTNDSLIAHIHGAQGGKVTKYILRQLRPGYFYVFDEGNAPYYWYAYVVTTDGMFYQYSVTQGPPDPENAKFDCFHKPEDEKRSKALSGSIVTLPTIDKGSVFYYAYAEHPWSREHLSMIRDTPAWRDANMQKFEVSAGGSITGQPHTFGIDELTLVAEYNGDSVQRSDFFWPAGGERRLFSPEEMIENMRDRLSLAPSWLQGQELILAVNDEAGIIDELNAYRMEPVFDFKTFLNSNNNQRKLVFMQTLEAFRENFRRAQTKEINEEYDEIRELLEGQEEREREEIEELKRRREVSKNEGEIRELDYEIQRRTRNLEKLREDLAWEQEDDLDDVNVLIEKREKQIVDYYDENQYELEDFKRLYYQQVELSEWLVHAFDADYAFWIRDHLKPLMDRCSGNEFPAGLGISGIVTSLLSGGILSPSSFTAWKSLSRSLSSSESALTRALFANQTEWATSATSDVTSLGPSEFVSPETLQQWITRYSETLAAYDESQRSELEKQWQTTLPALINQVGNAIAAIAMQESPFDTSVLTIFQRMAQILYSSDPDVRAGQLPPLRMVLVECNVDALQRWLTQLSKDNQALQTPRPRTPIIDNVMYFPDEQGGNIAVERGEDSGAYDIALSLPVVNIDLSRIDEVDREKVEKWQSDNAWGSLGTAKSAIGFVTMREVSRVELVGHTGKSVVSAISIVESVKTILEKGIFASGDRDNVDDAKVLAALGSLVKSGVEFRNAIKKIRNHPGGSSAAAPSFWSVRPEKLRLLNVIGAGGDVLSIYDGFKKLSEAAHDSRSGLSPEMAAMRRLQGGLSITSGGLGLAGLFIAGGPLAAASLGVALIVIALAYLFVELVAKAVYMWIDRSLLGNHRGQVEPFRSAEEETASLDLVFKGLTVDIQWENVHIYEGWDGELAAKKPTSDPYSGIVLANGKRFFVNISVPDLKNMRMSVESTTGNGAYSDRLFNYVYEKKRAEEDFSLKETKGESLGSDAEKCLLKDGFWTISFSRFYPDDMLSRNFSTFVKFFPDNAGRRSPHSMGYFLCQLD
ncbi:T6SS effector BTH_I2691 family protein [Halomonas sp. V046]|uniref:T6SS effector BTH_I2691 family protein n=1 Tax=Halomonas sp. V046 TaxID=3459611 RepID=UPI00404411E8